MEIADNKELTRKSDAKNKSEIYSKSVRAGKRTYFFDVKSTRNDEYYLIITESKRKFSEDGSYRYEKHKLFLYPEDFEKFTGSLEEVLQYIREKQPELGEQEADEGVEQKTADISADIEPEFAGNDFSNIDFEDI